MSAKESCIALIRALADAPGASGFEDEVLKTAREQIGSSVICEEDCLRNLYFARKSNVGNRPLVMLDAHSDEVGFMVHSIRPNGTLRVVSLGRISASSLPFSKVKVRNSLGEYIPGIFAAKPPHFMTAADKAHAGALEVSDLVLDIGAVSLEEAVNDYHIRIGEPAVPAAESQWDEEHGVLFGKAFDCRIGCAALIEVMRRIADMELPCDVVGVLSSQEELGERGCKVAVNHVKPDAAICFEGCPADDTFTEPYAIQTAMKKGPMFRHMDVSVVCNPRFQRFTLDLAHEKGLPVQESVREGGGNNAAVIQTALDGIPAVVAGVPVRYIHSMNCMAAYEDFETTVQLIIEMLKRLTKEQIAAF